MQLDAKPLVEAFRHRNINSMSQTDARNFHRAATKGTVTEPMADRLCIRYLKMPPELLWPELAKDCG